MIRFYVTQVDHTLLYALNAGDIYAFETLDEAKTLADLLRKRQKVNYDVLEVTKVYTTAQVHSDEIVDGVGLANPRRDP